MKVLFFTMILAFASHSSASELEESIPVDLARAMFELPHTGMMRFYSSLPENFPPFSLPPDFEILGGMTLPNYSRVGLKSLSGKTMSEDMASLESSLASDDYLVFPKQPKSQQGFVFSEFHPLPLNVCAVGKGSIRVRAIRRDDDVYFSLSGGPSSSDADASCEESVIKRQQFVDEQIFRESTGIRKELPRLAVPLEEDPSIKGFQPGMRWTGSETSMKISSQVPSMGEATALYQHFSDQLIAQQWESNQELRNDDFAQGEWVRTIEDDQLIFGFLKVERGDGGMFNLYFSISTSGDLYIQDDGMPRLLQ
jgi:hypothetical protein